MSTWLLARTEFDGKDSNKPLKTLTGHRDCRPRVDRWSWGPWIQAQRYKPPQSHIQMTTNLSMIRIMLTLLTLNCNSLHDSLKWPLLWQNICPYNPDIVALQESHLEPQQEYAFSICNPSYECFFAYGTSQSGGVLIMTRRNSVISSTSVIWRSAHLLILDIIVRNESFWV